MLGGYRLERHLLSWRRESRVPAPVLTPVSLPVGKLLVFLFLCCRGIRLHPAALPPHAGPCLRSEQGWLAACPQEKEFVPTGLPSSTPKGAVNTNTVAIPQAEWKPGRVRDGKCLAGPERGFLRARR